MNKRKTKALEGDIFCFTFWKSASWSELEVLSTFLGKRTVKSEQTPPKTWNVYIQVIFSAGLFWELEYFAKNLINTDYSS